MSSAGSPILVNDKKTIRAWAIFDWANSAYALVITAAIFPGYFLAITDDTINVLTKIIFSSKNFRKINIGSKKTYSVNDIVSLLKKKNISFDVEKKKSRPNEIKTFCADNSLIKKSYNFEKKINLNDGIDKIIDFYMKND